MSNDLPSGRAIAVKCRKSSAEEAAQILLKLIEDGRESLATEIIKLLDNMPFEYFDAILEYHPKLAELYNEAP